MPKLTTKQQLTLEVINGTVSLKTVVYQLRRRGITMVYSAITKTYSDPHEVLVVYQSTQDDHPIVVHIANRGVIETGVLENHNQLADVIKLYHHQQEDTQTA